MKKRDKIYDSPEYKQIKEHLLEILKELERDKGLSQYQIPEEWNGDFERIYQKECRKEHIKRRILAGACAAVILTISAVHIGTHLEFSSVAQADDIGKTKENKFENGDYQYNTYGNLTGDDLTVADDADMFFAETNIENMQNDIRTKVKRPIFYFTKIPIDAVVKDARYNQIYKTISFRIYIGDKYIYVSQQKQLESDGNGNINEDTLIGKIYNDNLEQNIEIYESSQDESLKCNILYDNTTMSTVSNLSEKEFENIIKNVVYK